MTHEHDADRQVDCLKQCLSTSKRPLGLFLGAGCPTAIRVEGDNPLIPSMSKMTAIIYNELSECEDISSSIRNIKDQLTADGFADPTVEDMLTHIRALRAVAGESEVRGLSGCQLDKLDAKICHRIHELTEKKLLSTETPYHHVASWVNGMYAGGGENPIEVFTTNYDLLMEQAFEESRVPYFDGFSGSLKPFFDLRTMEEDKLPARWARLWKLHGSVNWYHVEGKGVFRGSANEDEAKRVIYPSHLKYRESRRMPYLAMIDQLRIFLKRPNATFILCGCSFRDEHINEVILQGLGYTQGAIAFALLHGGIDKCPQAIDLADKRSNLNVLARDGAVIGGRKSGWLKNPSKPAPNGIGEWVKWMSSDKADESNEWKSEVNLGDFAVFGQFLREVTGSAQ